MILKISLRAKSGVPKILVERKLRLHSLYFPQNSLTMTESSGEFSDLYSIFRLRALRYRPFPSSLVPLFQSESKCRTILMKITLIYMKMKLHAELSLARLVLKQRQKRTGLFHYSRTLT